MKNTLITFFICMILGTRGHALSPEEINEKALHSEDALFTVGVKAGTLGLGLELSTPINSFMTLRLNANKFEYSTTDDSLYSTLLTSAKTYHLDTKGLLLDLHLWNIRVSTGLYINNNTITYLSKPKKNIGIVLNNNHYTLSDVTQIESTVSFNKLAPYLGVGWGNNGGTKGWNVSIDVGLMYHGDPSLEINLKTNRALTTSTIKNDLETERKKQEKELTNFPFYPVVMIGATYAF